MHTQITEKINYWKKGKGEKRKKNRKEKHDSTV
jgi:hypothetical protein